MCKPSTKSSASHGLPRSKFVEMIMPDASAEEKAEASRNWFAYLLILDSIAEGQEAATRPPRSKQGKRPDRRQQGNVAQG